MKVVSIQVGLPQEILFRDKKIWTGIIKKPVQGPVRVHRLGIDGDGQADPEVHGGVDKAVYAYSLDAYPWWKAHKPEHVFEPGAFGENLCIDEMPEDEIFIGDTFEIGKAVLQVADRRQPCYKLNAKFQDEFMVKTFMRSKRPGVYFRVLREGAIDVGDTFRLLSRENMLFSVAELSAMDFGLKMSPERALELLSLPCLTAKQRIKLQKIADN